MEPGDHVLLTVGEQTIEAEVTLASNGRPFAVTFDGTIQLSPNATAVGMLAIFANDDGSYRCAFTHTPITLQLLS